MTTEVVQFDARVFDQEARPAPHLVKDDFIVRQDGNQVVVKDVSYITRPAAPQRASAGRHEAPSEIAPLVFLIDDMIMTPDGFERVRRGLSGVLAEPLPTGTEVGILRTGVRGRMTTRLSADGSSLKRQVAEMRYLARSLRPGLGSASGASGPGTHERERTFVEGTLGSLNSLLVDLRRLPGRKTVVLLSEGLAIDFGSREWPEPIEARLNRLAQLAAEAGVTTHSIDVSGVMGGAPSLQQLMTLRDGLVTIADRMGGFYFGLQNELAGPLTQILRAERGYYLISYEPPPGTFVTTRPAPFRKLAVSVRPAGFTVRTRAGFFGASRDGR